ncbi:MAG: hypothetical protein DDT20_01170 [Firmicutes bacterium]|nr:hypothetical protein [Bacillota bacterium]
MLSERQKAKLHLALERGKCRLLGVRDRGMLDTTGVRELGRPCLLYQQRVCRNKRYKVRKAKGNRESDYLVVPKKQGSACSGKGVTFHIDLAKGTFTHRRRGTNGNGKRG